MEFRRTEEPRLIRGPKLGIQVAHGTEKINGVRAFEAARALAAAGSEWRQGFYHPQLDEAAVSSLETWLAGLTQETSMTKELRKELISARTHIQHLRQRQKLADTLFDGDLSSLQVIQGRIGTCYFLAPNVTLHQRPELLWALLPENFVQINDDAFRVRFPSIQNVFGRNFPVERAYQSLKTEVADWERDYRGKGKPGDIFLERAYASVIAEGKHGQANMTRRHDFRGRIAVERGLANEALASLIPPAWLKLHDHIALSGITFDDFMARIQDPRQLTYFSMDDFDDGVTRVEALDGKSIYKSHAYGIGRLQRGKVELHNPHSPQVPIPVDPRALYTAPGARLLRVEVNYHATPLMDHARMLRGLPSRRYQVNFLRNLMATHYDDLEKLLALPNTREALLLGGSEFVADGEFGELFQEANLIDFLTAKANGRVCPYGAFRMSENSPHFGIPAALGAGGALGFGIAAIVGGALVCSGEIGVNLLPAKSVRCPASVVGKWEYISGSDVLKGDPYRTRVALTVNTDVEGDTHPSVTVSNYPLTCLVDHAPYSVAAQMPVKNDTVTLTDPNGQGTYHFVPKLEEHELTAIQALSQVKKEVRGERDGWVLTCNGTKKNPVTKACVDEVQRWNAKEKK